MKKTLVGTALAAIMALGSLAFTACSKGENGSEKYSETYTGAVSATTYTSENDAIEGFLETEISGSTVTAVLVNYTIEEELTQSQVDSLGIDEEYTEDLKKVEKVNVEYSEESTSPYSVSVSLMSASTYTRTVYLLSYTNMFRFFVPALAQGDTLTASYYDSTFEAEKYINCTMKAVLTETNTYSGTTSTMEQTAIAKATRDALYEHDTVVYKPSVTENARVFEVYILNSAQRGLCAIDFDGGETPTINDVEYYEEFESVNAYFMNWFNERFGQLDHTFFTKTATGYALRGDRYMEFLAVQGYDVDDVSDVSYVINITDGRMSDIAMMISVKDENDNVVSSYGMTIDFYDFGTTVIDVPEAIAQLVK